MIVTIKNNIMLEVSYVKALAHLIRQLSELPTWPLLKELDKIAKKVCKDNKDSLAVDCALRNQYPSREGLILIGDGILFSYEAIKLVSTLLIYDVDSSSLDLVSEDSFNGGEQFIEQNGLYVLGTALLVIGIFLLANRVVYFLKSEKEDDKESLCDVSNYYSKCINDPASAIAGRLGCLYDTDYFNEMLADELGMTVSNLSTYFFYFYTVTTKCGFILDDFQKITKDKDREKMKKLLAEISISVRSEQITFSQVSELIKNILSTDQVRRGKPFLEINGRYYCIDSILLVDTLCNFPYHFLLGLFSEKKLKNKFFSKFGDIFENYVSLIANRAIGMGKWEKEFYERSKGREKEEYCDLFHKINNESVVFVEIKGKLESDDNKIGKGDSSKRFTCGSSNLSKLQKSDWGALQVVKHIKNYRRDYDYKGDVYGVVIFYGRFPETLSFDELVKKEIVDTEKYKAHMEHPRNHNIIMLSCINAELFFSAVKQGLSIEKMLKKLSSVSVIEISRELRKFIAEHNLRYSVGQFFDQELSEIREKTKLLIK